MLCEQNIELLNARFTKGGTFCFKLVFHDKLCICFVVEKHISIKILNTEPVNGCRDTPGYNCYNFYVTDKRITC